MASRLFGQWLIQHGCITAEQLLAALDAQLETNKRVGELALDLNILTRTQVAEIVAAQNGTHRQFGETAVELGLLTEPEVDRLLERQRGARRYIGEILVEMGHMSFRDTMAELGLFLAQQAPADRANDFDLQALAVETTDTDAYLSACLTMFERVANQELVLVKTEDGAFPRQEYTIMQVINPETRAYVALSLTKQEIIHIAQAMAGGEFDHVNQVVMEAAKEMVNVIMGNVAGWLAEEGVSFDPQPPELVVNPSDLPGAESHVTYSFNGADEPLELVVGY